uniref:Protein KRI1 homolog n=1 Tax=Timema cristinae TaxID=61476 RepID=A0A7R9CN66_TIMCR|nr:unnamed protein product [Timema cristinae]
MQRSLVQSQALPAFFYEALGLELVKNKYGEDAVNKLDDNDESSSDEENENAKELTEEFERDFLKTLSYLKKKDPCIYDKDTKFFEEYKSTLKQDGASEEKSKKKEKSLFLRDYERKLILEKGGKFTDDEGQKEELLDKKMESELKPLHDFWNDPQLDESLSGDEHTLGQQEEFERKFNFRFEEPDSEFTKRYPRVMEHSLRKKDDRRKLKREELKKRKQEEKVRKREELKRLRAMKRKEIETKLEKLKEITGNAELGFKDEDLEGEFNPAEYDKRMKELFSDEFYKEEDYSQKPEFPDIDEELEIENWERWRGEVTSEVDNGNEYQPHCEDPDFNMDCDYDPKAQFQAELIETTRRRKKGRRRSKLAQLLAKKKPIFEPNERTFDEYVNEYYKMDFEDVIGDLPCRFKYRNVVPNSFGLTTDEILSAKDKELNQWVSLGKAVQYRPETKELYDVKAYQNKAKNIKLKEKCLASLYSGCWRRILTYGEELWTLRRLLVDTARTVGSTLRCSVEYPNLFDWDVAPVDEGPLSLGFPSPPLLSSSDTIAATCNTTEYSTLTLIKTKQFYRLERENT